MQDLPPFFKEYIDSVFETHDNEIIDIKKEIHETKEDVKWLNQKVWMAMGALGVISMVGGIFIYYFKTLNKAQIEEAIRPLQAQTQEAKTTAENTNKTLQAIIRDNEIRVNYE